MRAAPEPGSGRVPGRMSRMTTPGPNPTDATEDWLSVGDTAKEVGVAAQTIRNWISAGALPTRTGRGPRGRRVEVNIDDVRKLASDRARSVPTADGEPASSAGPVRRTAAEPKVRAAEEATATTPGAAFPGAAGPSIEELQQVLAGLVSRIEALEGAVTGLQQHRAGMVRRGFFRRR
jgi:hypothetical protein